MAIFPWEIQVTFPIYIYGNPAVTVSHYLTLIKYKVHAGSFRISVIHRTLTWTTGSLTCVHDRSCACVYTRGLGTLTACQHNIFDFEKLTNVSCASDVIQTSVLWILSPTLYQLSHPVNLQFGRASLISFTCCSEIDGT